MTTTYAEVNGFTRSDARKRMHELPYGFGTLLNEPDFETAVESTIRAFEEQGFTIASRIDLQQSLRARLEVDFRRYVILAVCDLTLAELALEVDPHIGLLLPCNAVVQEGVGGGLYVAVESSQPLFRLTYHPRLKFVAVETERRLRMAVDGLK